MASFLFFLFSAIIDRATKVIALNFPSLNINLIPGFFLFKPALNNAGPLGLPLSNIIFFIFAVVGGGIVLWMAFTEKDRLNKLLLFLIVVGATSNIYDKFMYGFIIDAFRLSFGLIFNVADVLIVGGLVLVLIRNYFIVTPSSIES